MIADSATAASALAVAACRAGPEVTKQSFAAWGARAVRMVYEDQGQQQIVVGRFPINPLQSISPTFISMSYLLVPVEGKSTLN